jgi:hypothetical protein
MNKATTPRRKLNKTAHTNMDCLSGMHYQSPKDRETQSGLMTEPCRSRAKTKPVIGAGSETVHVGDTAPLFFTTTSLLTAKYSAPCSIDKISKMNVALQMKSC